ncbi:MAG: DUF1858 domain-containing protein [Candidatus Woesearchaeota archaeon]
MDSREMPEEHNDTSAKAGPIHKGMLISEIINTHPEIVPEIMSKGLHCIGCGASMFETLEDGLMMHGMNPEDIDRTIKELNNIIVKNLGVQHSGDIEEYFS